MIEHNHPLEPNHIVILDANSAGQDEDLNLTFIKNCNLSKAGLSPRSKESVEIKEIKKFNALLFDFKENQRAKDIFYEFLTD